MTCQELAPDATNGLKLTMVSIIFILQRPELLLLFMCTATKRKTLEVCWQHNTDLHNKNFTIFHYFSMKKMRNGW